ncbi:MAG: lytic murein transglycosylase [Mesorhizobium sp.]|nr:MAG: lytic murein transglycosylase [Mesorhizobium sp.]
MAVGRRASTPLWPAGHLPLKWGDRRLSLLSPISNAGEERPRMKQPISPLEGEMSGRTEGGRAAVTLVTIRQIL